MKKIKVVNVQFDVCTKDEALGRVLDLLNNFRYETGRQIVTPNPEMLLEAANNKEFQDVLNRAWLSIPDGIGILWASTFQENSKRSGTWARRFQAIGSLASLLVYPKFCKKIFTERITGVDFMESICSVSREKKTRIFLLGAKPGTAEKVKEILEIKYPGINIVGTFSGSPSEENFAPIQALIAETQPEILFVAYGAPRQEMWIHKHLPELQSVKIAMGVGGAFDFVSGMRRRAPKWMQRTGTEWAYRLIQEPSRIKRIWNAAVKFPMKVIKR